MPNLDQFLVLSRSRSTENRKFLLDLKKNKRKNPDEVFHKLHDMVFKEIDCLKCANCCKTTSPILTRQDIERLSKTLKVRPGDFNEKYVKIDEDGDYVFRSTPCPFLGSDNYCLVYEDRPKACREYPHTNRKKIMRILDLTYKNTLVCPAVLEIVERVKKQLKREFFR